MADHLISGYYVSIPETTLQSKQWRKLKAYSKVVFLTMGLEYQRTGSNANGLVTWTQGDLVKASGLSLRTVQRGIKELRENKFIVVWEPGGRWQRGTTYLMSSWYMDGRKETPKPT